MGFRQDFLVPAPPLGVSVTWSMSADADANGALYRLRELPGPQTIVGLGQPIVAARNLAVPGLRTCPSFRGPEVSIPATQAAVWTFFGGTRYEDLIPKIDLAARKLGAGFGIQEEVRTFVHDGGRDLSGYEDGTENPVGQHAEEVAVVRGRGPGMDGSSFALVQRWVHDLDKFLAMPQAQRDRIIGRQQQSNEELDDAPIAAHVKRAAQESYTPDAFMVRRSMPWADERGRGLLFVAYGDDLERFERVLRRMAGMDDGVTDAMLLTMSRAISSSWFWIPPLREDALLDLSLIGL